MQMFTDGMINFHHAYSKLIYAALIMAFAYSYSQDLRGQKIGIFGLPMQVRGFVPSADALVYDVDRQRADSRI